MVLDLLTTEDFILILDDDDDDDDDATDEDAAVAQANMFYIIRITCAWSFSFLLKNARGGRSR